MRRGPQLRLASCEATVREVLVQTCRRGRGTGVVMLTDSDRRLCGLFTDSDLSRLFEQGRDSALDRPIKEVMTADPLTVARDTRLLEAVEVLRGHKISELPVVDGAGRPLGLIDITDLIGLALIEAPASEVEAQVA